MWREGRRLGPGCKMAARGRGPGGHVPEPSASLLKASLPFARAHWSRGARGRQVRAETPPPVRPASSFTGFCSFYSGLLQGSTVLPRGSWGRVAGDVRAVLALLSAAPQREASRAFTRAEGRLGGGGGQRGGGGREGGGGRHRPPPSPRGSLRAGAARAALPGDVAGAGGTARSSRRAERGNAADGLGSRRIPSASATFRQPRSCFPVALGRSPRAGEGAGTPHLPCAPGGRAAGYEAEPAPPRPAGGPGAGVRRTAAEKDEERRAAPPASPVLPPRHHGPG